MSRPWTGSAAMFPPTVRAVRAARGRLLAGRLATSLFLLLFLLLLVIPAGCSRGPAPPPQGGQTPPEPSGVAERGAAPGAGDALPETVDLAAIVAPYEDIRKAYAAKEDEPAAGLDWKAVLEGYDPSAPRATEVAERGGIMVLGCELTLDFDAVRRCLDGKLKNVQADVDRRFRAAKADIEATFTKQLAAAQKAVEKEMAKANALLTSYKSKIADLQKQVQTVQGQIQAEVDRRMKQAQAEAARLAGELKTQLQAAQQLASKAQEQATRELQKATNLQGVVENLQKQLKEVQNTMGLNIDWQKQLFAGIQSLRLDELFRCLAEDAQAGKGDALQAIQQFTADPVRFAQRTLDDIIQQFGAKFDALLGQELRDLSEGKPFPTGPALARRAIDKFGILAEATGARCLFEHVRPQLEQAAVLVAQVATQAATKLQNEARRAFQEKVAPMVFKAMSSTLNAVLSEQLKRAGMPSPGRPGGLPAGLSNLLLTEDEMKGVARGVLYKRNIRERFEIAQLNIKPLLDPRTAPAAVNGHMENLKKLVQGTKDYEALYLEIGVEMLRVMAHKYMRSKEPGHGGQLLDQAIGLLHTGEGTVEKVVSALCGLIPELGAAACAVIEEVVELVWSNVAIVAVEGFAQDIINGAIDQLVDGLKQEMLRKNKLSAIRGSVGPLGEILRAFPHEQAIGLWAGAVMNEEMEMLNRHFSSLADLAAKSRA